MQPTWLVWSKTIAIALAMLGNYFLPLIPPEIANIVGPILIIINRMAGSQPPLTLTPTPPRIMQ